MGCVCACASVRVREWVSLLLPPADGFGLNNVIIKAFPEELPASPPVTPLPTINQLPDPCKSHAMCAFVWICVHLATAAVFSSAREDDTAAASVSLQR